MNWRGETFYGRNRVREVIDPARMREVAARPGRLWVVTEAERVPSLGSAVGPGQAAAGGGTGRRALSTRGADRPAVRRPEGSVA